MVADGLRRTGLRRGRRSPRCRPPTSAASSGSSADIGRRPDRRAARCQRQPAVAAGRRLHRRHRRPGQPRPAAPASRSPPRPARGGMRQVINKLITRGGPLRRGRRRLLPGLAPDEALLPHRPADRDRRGHARHRRAGPQLRRDRQAPHRAGRRSPASVGGFVPKPHTPFQWFGQNTADELRRKIDLLRDATAKAQGRAAQVARPAGHAGRGHRQPRRPPHRRGDRAGVARRRHVPGVERALRPRPLGGGDGGRGPVASTGTSTATAPRTRCCRGTTSRPACTRTSSGRTGRRALAEVGLEDCRWTPCYDCGVCTGYGIEHVVASPVPPAGGSQGTGQDLARGGEVAGRASCRAGPTPVGGGGVHAGAAALHQARQGPLHQPPRRGPHVGAGAAPGRLPVALHARASRPGPSSASGWPCRPATSRSASTSTSTSARGPPSTSTSLPARLDAGACPPGIDVPRRPSSSAGGEPSLQQAVTACRWEIEVAGVRRGGRRPTASPRRWPPTTLVITRTQGQRRHRRPPARHPVALTVVGPTAAGTVLVGRAGHAAPRAAARRSCSTPCFPGDRRRTHGCCAPTNGSSATAPAGSPSRSTRDVAAARTAGVRMRRERPDDRPSTGGADRCRA